jgi:hypothetical protein
LNFKIIVLLKIGGFVMNFQLLFIVGVVAFSVVSALLYVLPIIIYGAVKTEVSPSRRKLDIFLQHVIGVLSVATAIMSVIYFFTEYPK